MGKTPAIHLYSWSNGQFQAIACMKGFHTKGTTTTTTTTTTTNAASSTKVYAN